MADSFINSAVRYKRLYENCAVGIFELDLGGKLVSANPAMVGMLEYPSEQALLEASENDALFIDSEDFARWFAKLQREECVVDDTKAVRTRAGRRIQLQGTAWLVRDDDGRPLVYQGTAIDVSESAAIAQRLSQDFLRDALTSLPNRKAVEKRLRVLIDSAQKDGVTHALFYCDLDQFRVINNTLGHDAGDELLCELAAWLAARVAQRDTLARLGGDEFALILKNRDARQAEVIADNLLKCIRDFKFSWGDHNVSISASVGVVLIDSSTATVSQILGAADAACYTAKEKGRNRVHIQESNDRTVSRRISEMRTVIELKHAIAEERLELYRQPIVPLRAEEDGDRFELLVRMVDSDGRLLSPGQFLPAAEKYQLSPQVDRWVLHAFLRWLNESECGRQRLAYGAINLSGLTLGDGGFLSDVCDTLDRMVIPAERICFEITETAAINNLRMAQEFIETLRGRGCRFALDDFGSGVSSFGYLKHLPVDFIKIDGMFVRALRYSATDRTIVKAIKEVAHSSGLLTIAEFVEDEQTLNILRELGIDYAQGYALGRPAPLEPARNKALLGSGESPESPSGGGPSRGGNPTVLKSTSTAE